MPTNVWANSIIGPKTGCSHTHAQVAGLLSTDSHLLVHKPSLHQDSLCHLLAIAMATSNFLCYPAVQKSYHFDSSSFGTQRTAYIHASCSFATYMTFSLTSLSAVGRIQVVPLKEMTLSELKQHDGTDPDKPMYIAIRGTVFDVTTGKSAVACSSYKGQHSFFGYTILPRCVN